MDLGPELRQAVDPILGVGFMGTWPFAFAGSRIASPATRGRLLERVQNRSAPETAFFLATRRPVRKC